VAAVKPRGERVGWTRAEVSDAALQRFKALVQGRVNTLLRKDPLPEGYELTGVTVYYQRGNKYAIPRDDFNVIVDFDEQALSVFRIEGVKK